MNLAICFCYCLARHFIVPPAVAWIILILHSNLVLMLNVNSLADSFCDGSVDILLICTSSVRLTLYRTSTESKMPCGKELCGSPLPDVTWIINEQLLNMVDRKHTRNLPHNERHLDRSSMYVWVQFCWGRPWACESLNHWCYTPSYLKQSKKCSHLTCITRK